MTRAIAVLKDLDESAVSSYLIDTTVVYFAVLIQPWRVVV